MKTNNPPLKPANTPTAANIVQIGALAPQLKQVIKRMVLFFSFSSSNVLVAIIAGTLHPNPVNIGIKAFPDKPNFLKALSKMKATRAIYPLSSKIAINKNSNKI